VTKADLVPRRTKQFWQVVRAP